MNQPDESFKRVSTALQVGLSRKRRSMMREEGLVSPAGSGASFKGSAKEDRK